MYQDERMLEALRQRMARFDAIGAIGSSMYQTYLAEIPRLIKWLVGVPMFAALVEEIRTMHADEERELRVAFAALGKEMAAAAETFRSKAMTAQERNPSAALTDTANWNAFAESTAVLITADDDLKFQSLADAAKTAATILQRRAMAARADHVNAIAEAKRDLDIAEVERASAADNGEPPEKVEELRAKRDAASDAWNALEEEWAKLDGLTKPMTESALLVDHYLRARQLTEETSPSVSLHWLIGLCRAHHPPIDGIVHWTDAVIKNTATSERDVDEYVSTHFGAERLNEKPADVFSDARIHLARFVEELQVLGLSSLSSKIIVERFKERSINYDKPRLRAVASARKGGGTREDRLTFELAKYLHDHGIFVFARLRLSNLEPDLVGMRRLAIESKAYNAAKGARADIVKGYYQLHAYLTALETEAMRVTEGFLVIFRVDEGPIFETPPTLYTERFRIHSLTIDIATGKTSGRKQPKTEFITKEEIFAAIKAKPKKTAGRKRASRGTKQKTSTRKAAASKRK